MLGALHTRIKISTNDLAERLGISQQTVSRHLIELEKQGYLERQRSYQGTYLKINGKGRKELERIYTQLKGVLEKKLRMITLDGDVINGLGEGSYYMKRKGYRNQFLKELGFDPYPGTLNLKLLSQSIMWMRSIMDNYPSIFVGGFTDSSRSYGWVKCYPSILNNGALEKAAVIVLERTHYDKSILEVIAPVCIKEKLGIKNGDYVKVFVAMTETG